MVILERKIQLELTPPNKTIQTSDNKQQQKRDMMMVALVINGNSQFREEHIIIDRPKFSAPETSKGFKM